MTDAFGRTIDYMRISLTDRCDLRCRYCMPARGIEKVHHKEILSSEEIVQVCKVATSLGINKFKLTGGEPLVRCDFVRLLAMMRELPDIDEISMTTNGQQLAKYIDEIGRIGIDGINISLDTLRPDKFKTITRIGDLEKTLEAVDLCLKRGIKTKLNCLVMRGFNDDEIIELAEFAMDKGLDIRYIELMPIGFANSEEYVPADEILERLMNSYPELTEDNSRHGNGPAIYYKLASREGSIGIISSVRGRICNGCNRVRLTSMGYIKPCLCYDDKVYIRPYISKGEEALKEAIAEAIKNKPAHHSFDDTSRVDRHAMVEIGG